MIYLILDWILEGSISISIVEMYALDVIQYRARVLKENVFVSHASCSVFAACGAVGGEGRIGVGNHGNEILNMLRHSKTRC